MRTYSYWLRGDFEAAKDWGRRGVDLKRTANVDTKFDCAHDLALAQRDSGEVELALKYFLQDETVEELLTPHESGETRQSSVFGNVGRCLWLMGDFANSVRCLRRSAKMLETETHLHSLLNQGYAALWLAEALDGSGQYDLAYCFLRRAQARWKTSSPMKSEAARQTAVALTERHKELLELGALSERQVEHRCREWVEQDVG